MGDLLAPSFRTCPVIPGLTRNPPGLPKGSHPLQENPRIPHLPRHSGLDPESTGTATGQPSITGTPHIPHLPRHSAPAPSFRTRSGIHRGCQRATIRYRNPPRFRPIPVIPDSIRNPPGSPKGNQPLQEPPSFRTCPTFRPIPVLPGLTRNPPGSPKVNQPLQEPPTFRTCPVIPGLTRNPPGLPKVNQPLQEKPPHIPHLPRHSGLDPESTGVAKGQPSGTGTPSHPGPYPSFRTRSGIHPGCQEATIRYRNPPHSAIICNDGFSPHPGPAPSFRPIPVIPDSIRNPPVPPGIPFMPMVETDAVLYTDSFPHQAGCLMSMAGADLRIGPVPR